MLVTFLYGELGLYSRLDQAERMAQPDERINLFLAKSPDGDSHLEHDQNAGKR